MPIQRQHVSRGFRKYLRHAKAEIRRATKNPEEAKRAVDVLQKRFAPAEKS